MECRHFESIRRKHKYCSECGAYLKPIIESIDEYYVDHDTASVYNYYTVFRQYHDHEPIPVISIDCNSEHTLGKRDAKALAEYLVEFLNDMEYDKARTNGKIKLLLDNPKVKK